jgi:hypothetical protein
VMDRREFIGSLTGRLLAAPVPARNVRRSIIGSSRSVQPSLPPQSGLLGKEPLEVVSYLGPVFG